MDVKLTDSDMMTMSSTQWVIGEPMTDTKLGGMCMPGGFHFYRDNLLATMMNPSHGEFSPVRAFECEPMGEIADAESKSKAQSMTLLREIALPDVGLSQRIVFSALVAWRSLKIRGLTIPAWESWADRIVRGSPFTPTAGAVADDDIAAAYAYAAEAVYVYATSADARSTDAAYAAACAAGAVEEAACATGGDAAIAAHRLNLIGLAHEAMK